MNSPLRLALPLAVLSLCCTLFLTRPAAAATLVVTTTADSGAGSLRQAILDSNASTGVADTITFNIAGTGIQTISPASALPAITDPVTIDGFTQTGATANTLTHGNNAVMRIVLNGANAGAGISGLVLAASNSTVRGLVVHQFASAAIDLTSNNNVVQGNYLGTNSTGTTDLGNGVGVSVDNASNNLIGGTTAAAANLISGNGAGIAISGAGANANTVQGNEIGTTAAGTAALANGPAGDGVLIAQGSNNVIGGTSARAGNVISGNGPSGVSVTGGAGNVIQGNLIGTDTNGTVAVANTGAGINLDGALNTAVGGVVAGAANVIAFNSGDGVAVINAATGNTVRGNSIFSNGGASTANLGIDLGNDSVTANDPGDADTGPNNLQNFPVLTSATTPAGGPTVVNGGLNSLANTSFAVDLYRNDAADPSGFGEGQVYVDTQNLSTDSGGNVTFTFSVTGAFTGKFFTATATNFATGDTSEFGQDLVVPQALTLSITPNSFSEAGGANAATGTVTRNTSITAALTVNLSSSNTGKATVPATVVIPAGSSFATFPVAAVDNAIVDGPQAVTITAAQTGFASATAAVTVTDNDVPALVVSVTPNTFSEAGGVNAATGTVTRNTSTTAALTVNLSSLTASGALRATVPATVTIPAGAASATFAVAAVDNTIVDGSQQVTIQASQTGFTSGSTTVTVTDNDVATFTVSVTPTTFNEGAGANAATGTVTRNTPTAAAQAVNLSSSNTSKATVPATVTIPAGAASVNFTVAAVDNAIVDGALPVTITASQTGFTSGAATVTVTDNDTARLTLSVTPTTFSEADGARAATGTITRNTPTATTQVVNLTSSNTNKVTVPATVTIPAGAAATTFFLSGVNNAIAEGTQPAVITASQTGFVSSAVTVNVTDNDVATLSVSVAPSTFSEGAGPFAATGTVRRNTPTTGPLTVNLASRNTTKANVPATVIIPAGAASANFFVAAVDNTVADGPLAVALVASQAGFASGVATVTVTDNDTAVLTLSISPTTFSEAAGAAAATATITRNTLTTASLTVNVTSSDTTAATVPATVTIPAGRTSATFPIAAVDDLLADGTQTATITVAATGFAPVSQGVAVTDNETPLLSLRVSPTTFSEAAGAFAATGTVTRNTPTAAPLTVALASSNTSKALVPATVTIQAGAASANFSIAAVDNTLRDGSFAVTIAASAAGLAPAAVVVTVTDNDGPVLTVTVTPATFSEAAGPNAATATVTRNTSTAAPLTVVLGTSDPTKVTVPSSVTIPAGAASVSFPLAAVDNNIADGPRTVTINAGATGFFHGSATVTVTDNEPPGLSISGLPTQVAETAGTVLAALQRGGSTAAAVEVHLASSNPGAATVPATVVIPAGAASAPLPITIVDDGLVIGAKSTTITATAAGLFPVAVNLAIPEGDAPRISLTVSPASFSEAAGDAAATGFVTRNTPASAPLVVALRSSNPGQVRVPASITIPSGAASASFVIGAIDDLVLNGNHTVDIVAFAGSLTSRATVTLIDNDRPALSLTISPASFSEGASVNAALGTVRRNTPVNSALVVQLISDTPSRATVPPLVTIPVGAASATFAVGAIDNSLADGPHRVTVHATAPGYLPAAAAFTVQDNEPASHFSISGHVTTTVTTSATLVVGLGGVAMQLFTGTTLRDVTSTFSNGAYAFHNLPPGSYLVTPAKPLFVTVPTTRAATITTADANNVDFNALARGRISGRIGTPRADGGLTPMAGAIVVAHGAGRTVTAATNVNGAYVLDGLGLGTYVVTPSRPRSYFLPRSATVALTPDRAELIGLNFNVAGTDAVAPAVAITSPLPGTYTVATQPLRMTGVAADTGGAGLAAVTVAIERFVSASATAPSGFFNWSTRGFVTTDNPLQVEQLALGTGLWTATLPTLPVGFYGQRATATDAAGNLTRSALVRLVITASTATTTVSTATASVAASSITLGFNGSLDSATAGDASHYRVTVGGLPVFVESAGYNLVNHNVVLGLSEGSLQVGDAVAVSWSGLSDSAGHAVAGQAAMTAR